MRKYLRLSNAIRLAIMNVTFKHNILMPFLFLMWHTAPQIITYNGYGTINPIPTGKGLTTDKNIVDVSC